MYTQTIILYIGFYIVSFGLQGILVHMFRELIGYCTTAITFSGFYSLAVQRSTTMTLLTLGFGQEMNSIMCVWAVPPVGCFYQGKF